MGIQSLDGQSAAYFPGYTAQGTASGRPPARPAALAAGEPGGPARHPDAMLPTPEMQLEEAMARVQNQLKEAGVELNFSFDKEAGKTIVKVIDPATREVLRQMPSKEMLALAENLDKITQGLLISQKA